MSEFEQFLSQLRAEGAPQSEGSFSVSLATAEEKLQKFALTRAELYIVQLVAAAVAGGAGFMTIRSSLSQIELVFDGEAPDKHQLENLNSFLFHTVDAPEYLSELAVGAYGALALPAKRVLIDAFRQDGCWRLDLRENKQSVSELRLVSPHVPLLRVVIDKGFGLRTDLLGNHPEQAEIQRCALAPIDLQYDDMVVAHDQLTIPKCAFCWARLTSADLPLVRLESDSEPDLVRELPKAAGYLMLSAKPPSSQHYLRLVLHGVDFPYRTGLKGPSILSGVVHVRGLRKDISRNNLVENQDFLELTTQLAAIGWELLVNLCRQPEATVDFAEELLVPVREGLSREDLPAEQRAVLEHWQYLHRSSKRDRPQDHFETLEEAHRMQAQGRDVEATRLRAQVVKKTSEQLAAYLENNRLDKMLGLCDPLIEALRYLNSPRLKRCLQGRDILGALLLGSGPSHEAFAEVHRWGIHRKALLHRFSGNFVEAAEMHAEGRNTADNHLRTWAFRYCAELELARANYDLADRMMAEAHRISPDSRDLAEERAFLKRLVSADGKTESVLLLRRAKPGPDTDPFVQWLYLDWLVREGRGTLTLEDWVQTRARASILELSTKLKYGTRSEIERRLNPGFDCLGWQSLQEARKEKAEAVQIAEREFGPIHSYTQFTRRRAVYQLHRLEAHEMADRLQCRGHLLAQLRACLKGLDQRDEADGPSGSGEIGTPA